MVGAGLAVALARHLSCPSLLITRLLAVYRAFLHKSLSPRVNVINKKKKKKKCVQM